MRKFQTLLLSIVSLSFLFAIPVLPCELGIPSGSYSGATTQGVGAKYGSSAVTVTVSGQSATVSDFSAGFFGEFGHTLDYSKVLQFNCDGSLQTQSFSTEFGPTEFTSGSWDATNQTITINWSIPGNGVNETTVLTYE